MDTHEVAKQSNVEESINRLRDEISSMEQSAGSLIERLCRVSLPAQPVVSEPEAKQAPEQDCCGVDADLKTCTRRVRILQDNLNEACDRLEI